MLSRQRRFVIWLLVASVLVLQPGLGQARNGLRARPREAELFRRDLEARGLTPQQTEDVRRRLREALGLTDPTAARKPRELMEPRIRSESQMGALADPSGRAPKYVRWVQESLNRVIGAGL